MHAGSPAPWVTWSRPPRRSPPGCAHRAGQPRRDGAVLVDAGALVGPRARAAVVSTVGAGDAMLAGYLSCAGAAQEALAAALHWGAAAVQHEGTLFPHNARSDVPVTVTEDIDSTRVLHDDGGRDPAMTSTMQAVVIHGREDYRLEEVPVPLAGTRRSTRQGPGRRHLRQRPQVLSRRPDVLG